MLPLLTCTVTEPAPANAIILHGPLTYIGTVKPDAEESTVNRIISVGCNNLNMLSLSLLYS